MELEVELELDKSSEWCKNPTKSTCIVAHKLDSIFKGPYIRHEMKLFQKPKVISFSCFIFYKRKRDQISHHQL